MASRRKRIHGFTLIEVLVVVAIIALLISILLPSLNRAREQARRVLCSTQMRTVSQASIFYCQANQDFFPYGSDFWEVDHRYAQKGLPEPIKDLTKIAKGGLGGADAYYCAPSFYICPKDEKYHTSSQVAKWTLPDGRVVSPFYCLSYCVPDDLLFIRNAAGTSFIGSRKMSSLKRQSDMCLAGEYQDDSHTMRAGWMLTDSDNNQAERWQLMHMSGCDAVYLDTHVQYHKRLEPSNPASPPAGWQYGLPPYPQALVASYTNMADWKGAVGHTATVASVPWP